MPENIFGKPGLASDQLPSVTSADNDKVLTVKNGKWDKAEPSGGGGSGSGLVTHMAFDSDAPTCDTTWQEIADAMESGTNVVLLVTIGGSVVSAEVVVSAGIDGGGNYYISTAATNDGSGIKLTCLTPDDYPAQELA